MALYIVSRLVLSPNVTRPAAQQQHRVSWGVGWGGVGGPGHYVVTPARVEVELGLSWAVTMLNVYLLDKYNDNHNFLLLQHYHIEEHCV